MIGRVALGDVDDFVATLIEALPNPLRNQGAALVPCESSCQRHVSFEDSIGAANGGLPDVVIAKGCAHISILSCVLQQLGAENFEPIEVRTDLRPIYRNVRQRGSDYTGEKPPGRFVFGYRIADPSFAAEQTAFAPYHSREPRSHRQRIPPRLPTDVFMALGTNIHQLDIPDIKAALAVVRPPVLSLGHLVHLDV